MLNKTKVALGISMGAVGSKYISGRVDKACLEVTDNSHPNVEDQEAVRHIGLVAEIVKPYAVYVRNIVK